MKSTVDPGLSVNFHLTEACNACCSYCFATFPHLGRRNRLSPADREALIDAMVDAGVGKINFAGGEPTLMRDLGPLCKRIKKRSRGRCAVSLVTNGARLGPLLEDWAEWIDWVALSVDSGDDGTNVALGRTRAGRPYAPVMLELGAAAKRRGVRLKCNTVVSRLNVGEDMSDFVSELAPERWKLFQMLPVAGENDSAVRDLSISETDFRAFVERHRALREAGVVIVPEDNDAMTDSYLMIGPDGRFFWHVPHASGRTLDYGPPILKAGFSEALRQTGFSQEKFHARGGAYDWLRQTGEAPHA
ncbi:MAG: viperin family antiviral radical SAM protein [Rhodospirillales bacterium]|nr:viperin family antiviral radical SAM protein [Rhodospirillales bacterium]